MLPLNQVFHLDCFDFLAKVDDNSVDLAILDPPYNMQKAEWDTFSSQEDFLFFTYKWIDFLLPKIKHTGSLYIFNTPFNSAYILQYLITKKMILKIGLLGIKEMD